MSQVGRGGAYVTIRERRCTCHKQVGKGHMSQAGWEGHMSQAGRGGAYVTSR